MELGKKWIAVKSDGNDYLIKCQNLQHGEVIFTATDFINLWQLQLGSLALFRIVQDQNPLIESEFEELLKVSLSLFAPERNDVGRSIKKQDDSSLKLLLRSDLAGIPFELSINLSLLSAVDYHKIVTVPLLITVRELLTRQETMSKLLRDKDLEIQQYKLEGVTLTRKHLQTSPFEEELFELSREHELSGYTETPTLLFDEQFIRLFGIISANINKIEEVKRKDVNKDIKEDIANIKEQDVSHNKHENNNIATSKNISKSDHDDVGEINNSGIRKLAVKRKKYVPKLNNL